MNPHLSHLNTEKLIKLVSKYPELYDTKHKDYGDMHKRESIWQRIGKELSVPAQLCKAKWNILRGGYRRVLRNKETSFGGRKWRFEDDMSFLKESVMERRRHSAVCKPEDRESVPSENEEEFITIVKEEPMENLYDALSDNTTDNIPDEEWVSTCGSTTAGELEYTNTTNNINSQSNGSEEEIKDDIREIKEGVKDVDAVTHFFLSLAETVKSLPPVMQAQVKAEVFQAVNMAELKHLQEKSGGSCKCEKNMDHTYT